MEATIENKIKKYEHYKDSSVEWLGEIPEHWEVKKLKFIGNVFSGLTGKSGEDFSKEFSPALKPFIPFTNICNNLKISPNQFQYVRVSEKEFQNTVIKNDILFLMSSETPDDIGKCSIYLENDPELYLNSFCKGFRIKNLNIFPEYINYLLLSNIYRNYFSMVGRGFTRINLRQEYINDAYVALPPSPRTNRHCQLPGRQNPKDRQGHQHQGATNSPFKRTKTNPYPSSSDGAIVNG